MEEKNPKISILIAARKNSKYLAKFLFGYLERTQFPQDCEVLVMLNEGDTWNNELVEWFEHTLEVEFYYEDKKLGRAGLHEYFNDLYKHSSGDWIIYFCEDHFIIKDNWDAYLLEIVKDCQLDPKDVHCIVPKFDNAGAMNHMLSRGFCEAMGGVLGRHGWIDSYINHVFESKSSLRHRPVKPDQDLFHDFTHDVPNPMDDVHLQADISAGKILPHFDSDLVRELIRLDSERLEKATEKEQA